MASEIQLQYTESGDTLYALIRRASDGKIWNGGAFVTYATADLATYTLAMTEQGSASKYYTATFPVAISSAVLTKISIFKQLGGSPAESDTLVGFGDFDWAGVSLGPASADTSAMRAKDVLLGEGIAATIARYGQPADKSVLNALRLLLNQWDTESVPGQIIATREDDSTEAFRKALTVDPTAQPVVRG